MGFSSRTLLLRTETAQDPYQRAGFELMPNPRDLMAQKYRGDGKCELERAMFRMAAGFPHGNSAAEGAAIRRIASSPRSNSWYFGTRSPAVQDKRHKAAQPQHDRSWNRRRESLAKTRRASQ